MRGKRCQCADGRYGGCGRVFSRPSVFDRHHVHDPAAGRSRRCITDEELEARGLVLGSDGVWRGKGGAREWPEKVTQRCETGVFEARATQATDTTYPWPERPSPYPYPMIVPEVIDGH